MGLLMTALGVVRNHYFFLWAIDGFVRVALLSPLILLGIQYFAQFAF